MRGGRMLTAAVLAVVLASGCGTGSASGPALSATTPVPTAPITSIASVEPTPSPSVTQVPPTESVLPPTPTATSSRPTVPASVRPSVATTTIAPAPGGSLAGKVVVIDPGHGGKYSSAQTRLVPAGNGRMKACNTSGTAGPDGYPEHAFTFDVATRLAAVLRARGATVVMTRTDDASLGPCIDQRAAVGNQAGAALVISIHADSAPTSARGFHVIHSTTMVGGDAVEATSLAAAKRAVSLLDGTGMPRSTYIGGGTALSPRDDIGGLNLSQRPGIMVEAGNMANRADLALQESPAWRQRLAEALAQLV